MDRTTVIGTIGTITSVSLGQYHDLAAIGAALATILYMGVKTYFIIKAKGE